MYVVPFHTRKHFTTLWVNSPSFSGRIVPLFDSMLVQQGKGSGTPTKPYHKPSPEAQYTSHTTHSSLPIPSVTTAPIPLITSYEITPIRQYTRRARIAQSYALPLVEDELASPLRDVKGSGDDSPITGSNLDEREAIAESASDNTEEMATVLTSMDATTILASGAAEVPTAGPPAAEVLTGSDVAPTASPVFSTATVIARDAEIARIHAEEELQIMIDGLDRNNETIAKYLHEYHQFALELPIERRIELISDLVKYQDNYSKDLQISGSTKKAMD
nr:hypothetical protein [Tanacetum cinerariifolium]